jgi:hypothetical protein
MNRFSTVQICHANHGKIGRQSILLLVMFCCGSCYGQESAEIQAITGEAHAQTGTAPNSVDEKIIEEISAIRSRLGGGVASQLTDLLPDSTTSNGNKSKGAFSLQQMQSEFEAELRKLATSQDSIPLRGVAAIASPPPHIHGSVGPVNVNKVGRPTTVSVCLRRAARNLEIAAAALEEAERFSQADELRESARQLWVEARIQNVCKPTACTTVSNPDTPAANR